MELNKILNEPGAGLKNKAELRKIFRKKRALLTEGEVKKLSRRILIQFSRLELADIRYVQSFIPSQRLVEPDTLLLVDHLKNICGQIVVAAPSVNRADYSMESVIISDKSDFKKNGLGISEPLGNQTIRPELFDLILVPLVCFDENGNRVGHGKGYYDRYLKRCRGDALKVGISLFEPVYRILDVKKNDVRMDYCCTPQKLYSWK